MSSPTVGLESLEALDRLKAKEADDAQIDAKYENPEQLAGDMADVNEALYGGAFIPPEERGQNTGLNDTGREEINPDDYLEAQFIALENGGNKLPEERNSNNDKQGQNIHTPPLNYLLKKGVINSGEADKLIQYFTDGGVVDEIPETDIFTDNTKSQDVVTYINQMTHPEEQVDKNLEKFGEIFGEELGIDIKNEGGKPSDRENEAYNIIGEHFFTLEGVTGEGDYDDEFHQAIQTAYNKLLDGGIDIKGMDEKFQKLSKTILDDTKTPKERFEAFVDFLQFEHTKKGIGKFQDKAFRQVAEKKLIQANISEIFYKNLQQFQKSQKGTEEYIKLAVELEEMRKEAGLSEPEATLLSGGELDAGPDTQAENTREA